MNTAIIEYTIVTIDTLDILKAFGQYLNADVSTLSIEQIHNVMEKCKLVINLTRQKKKCILEQKKQYIKKMKNAAKHRRATYDSYGASDAIGMVDRNYKTLGVSSYERSLKDNKEIKNRFTMKHRELKKYSVSKSIDLILP